MEDLARYLGDIVEPTVKDFENNPTSVRHAFLACVVVFHGVDYLAYPRTKPATLRQQFGRQSDAFKTVDRVAHAFKHVITDCRNPLKSDDVISRPAAMWGEAVWDLSRWDDPVGGVTLDSERDVDLLDAVKRAYEFLSEQINPIQK